MILQPTRIDGLFVAESHTLTDERGSFYRAFCATELTVAFGNRTIAQINHSHTKFRGAIRGMHFQYPPFAEMKLIRCLRGRVADVAVDLRDGSPTFLQWHLEELSKKNNRMIIIPEGFAHGFQALEPDSELLYLHTAPYRPTAESALRYNDPRLAIDWPLPITQASDRDSSHPLLSEHFRGIRVTGR